MKFHFKTTSYADHRIYVYIGDRLRYQFRPIYEDGQLMLSATYTERTRIRHYRPPGNWYTENNMRPRIGDENMDYLKEKCVQLISLNRLDDETRFIPFDPPHINRMMPANGYDPFRR